MRSQGKEKKEDVSIEREVSGSTQKCSISNENAFVMRPPARNPRVLPNVSTKPKELFESICDPR